MPQVFYHFVYETLAGESASPDHWPIVAVPSGNFGNLTAGLIAKRIGLSAQRFVAATNVNDVVPEYLVTGHYQPRPSVRTVANAMDVGAPSNFERIQALYSGDLDAIRRDVAGAAFADATVVAAIRRVFDEHGYLLDPHGAIAWLGLQQELERAGPAARGVFLATAHPAKFGSVVEPAIGRAVPLPPALADAVAKPRFSVPLPVSYPALVELIRK
jgi:threonine synthase